MTKNWKLKDVVLMSMLGVVFGLIYLAFFGVGNILFGALTPLGLGPLGYEFIFGIWFIVSIVAAYIIRKPGVAFTSETIAALTEVLIGSTSGPTLILSGMVQGLGAELAFAATGWKDYRLRILIFSGIGAAVISFPYHYFMSGYDAYASWLVGLMFVTRIISGAILSGLLGKVIADQLASTGVLSGYPLGRERQKKREQRAS
ncbi:MULTISPECIES: ECF transporter S component [Oceanobacillus]|uniref:HMP/thiamine permease protein YkoE n=1 Tax=Oceanobacillus kimchii TaxID=746691 RepID=A0ABQ5TI09_9BACI|nr:MULTISPECIES: ECF transporter S component [Oceanobacillus]MBT2601002.1 ECF transporter S component [Oceanobacillus sp. ISL-74]MBT2653547.1 ECF transporter S component [Oceanobacillus sp. ISL-73]MCT1578776.1 ECF transporter S component [Oceanobacillus kimchii]MCT2137774.1 ECF transporter S component [Oceanobacillus kimchii]OEH53320.1 thiamine permease [Oceanobacillus sp. E9]